MAVREPTSFMKKGFWGSVVQVGPAPYVDRGPGHYQADNTETIRPGGDTGTGKSPSTIPFVHEPFVQTGFYDPTQFKVRAKRIGGRSRETSEKRSLRSLIFQNAQIKKRSELIRNEDSGKKPPLFYNDSSVDPLEEEMIKRYYGYTNRIGDILDEDWFGNAGFDILQDFMPGTVGSENPSVPFQRRHSAP